MASATLQLEYEEDSRLVFRIEGSPFNAPPFAGPPSRDWDEFVVESPSEATYEWRTGADRVRDLATRLVREGLCEEEVQGAFARSYYLREQDEKLEDSMSIPPVYDYGIDPENELARQRLILKNIASGVIEPAAFDGFDSYYQFESDSYLHDAAHALELPPGARIVAHDDGGPGSGYTAQFLELAPGMTLSDYAAWLASRHLKEVAVVPVTPERHVSWLKNVLVPELDLKGGGGRIAGWEVGGFSRGVRLGFVGLQNRVMRVQLHAHDTGFVEEWRQALANEAAQEELPVVAIGPTEGHVYLRFEWVRADPDDYGPEQDRVRDAAYWLIRFARRHGLLRN